MASRESSRSGASTMNGRISAKISVASSVCTPGAAGAGSSTNTMASRTWPSIRTRLSAISCFEPLRTWVFIVHLGDRILAVTVIASCVSPARTGELEWRGSLAEQLHDRFARGDRPGSHLGVERHPKRMIQGRTEVLRPDRMVLHVGADLVGRAIDAATDAGSCEQCGKACRPMVTAVHAKI